MTHTLYQLIVHPHITLQKLATQPLPLGKIVSVILVLLSSLVLIETPQVTLAGTISVMMLRLMLIILLLIFQAVTTDLLAQLISKPANSLKLFQLLSIGLFPILLDPVFTLILSHAIIGLSTLTKIASLALTGYSLYLQVLVIKYTYTLSTKKAVLLYLGPIFLIFILVATTLVAFGISL
jgi:hypothetical protein